MSSGILPPVGASSASSVGAGLTTGLTSRNAVARMSSLTRAGSSTPGSWTTMRSLDPLALDDRLGDAELVDAVADRLEALADGEVLEELDGRGLQGEGQLVPGEGVFPVPGVLIDEVPGLAFLVRGGPGEHEAAGPLLGGPLEDDVVLLEQLFEPGDLLVGFQVDGVIR